MYLNNFPRRQSTGRGVVNGTWWALEDYHSPTFVSSQPFYTNAVTSYHTPWVILSLNPSGTPFVVGPPTFLSVILHKCRHFSLDVCCYFLVVSGWSLLFLDGLWMDAVIS